MIFMNLEFGLFLYVVIILSAVFHEYMHGWMAYQLGDSTAKDLGRLSLNPIRHMELFGTVLLPLFLILMNFGFLGWAKPVPYNPYNLRDQKYGNLKVALAGPGVNLLIAAILSFLVRFDIGSVMTQSILSWIIYINIFLALFNLIPVPPLDGSKLLMDLYPRAFIALKQLSFIGIALALIIAFYFLNPIANVIYFLLTNQQFTM